MAITEPRIWEPGSPNLYTAEAILSGGRDTADSCRTTFGIRTIRYTADRGFLLNGRKVLLKGVCIHHDGGCTGAAVPPEIWERRLGRLKDMGEEDRKILLGEDPMVNPDYTVMKTDFDTEVMVLRSADPEVDFASFVTLYKGYEVGLNLFPGEDSTESLTDDQIALAMKFLSDLDFVPFGAE